MRTPRNRGIAEIVSAREAKVIIIPDYGKDITMEEALEGKLEFTYSVQHFHNMELKVEQGTLHWHTEYTRDASIRLASFLLQYPALLKQILSTSEIVLDLDCGHGFCGITALQLGYESVVLINTSADVVQDTVWPNIIMNCGDKATHARCIASSNWIALSEYLSDPGNNKWTVIYKLIGLVLVTISSIRHTDTCERLHSLLLRHLTATGIALVGLHTAISVDTPLPVPLYLRRCFEHALLQSPACEGTHLCDIVRISRRQPK